jgi:TetR/AcrR family transcriptional regulator
MSKRASAKPQPKDLDLPTRARAAAVRLFSRHGYEGTSVQQIADELGVTKQALLYHFASKEGLRAAALDEMVTVWRQVLPRLLAALTRPPGSGQTSQTAKEDALEQAFSELLAFVRSEPAYPRFLMQELLRPGDAAHPILHDIEPWVKLAADLIRSAQAEGKVDAGVDPEAWIINLGTSILAMLCLVDEPSAGKPAPKRIVREMVRIARSSLLTGR